MIFVLLTIIALVLIIASIIGICHEIFDPIMIDGWHSYIVGSGILLLMTILISILIIMVHLGIYAIFECSFKDVEMTEELHQDIVSISSQSNTEGSFVLGFGYVDSKEYYYHYWDRGNNRFQRQQIPACNTVIIEHEEIAQPTMNWKRDHCKLPMWIGPVVWKKFTDHSYEYNVPQGTIVRKFSL